MLSVRNLSVSYSRTGRQDRLRVLDDISFTVPKGEHWTVVGPSGCGKTSLLFAMSGLLTPPDMNGVVQLGGSSTDEARRAHKIGFVFQRPPFFEWLTVRDNVAVPLRIRLPEVEDVFHKERADRLLLRFGLSGFEDAFPHELSGGMLSRVAIARALVHEPSFIVLDEAFNHLDEVMRRAIHADLEQARLEWDVTAIGVTHDVEEAVLTSDVVLVLSQKPARVAASVQVDLPHPRVGALRQSSGFREIVGVVRDALAATYTGFAV